jgi:dATP pyrophosphohydrolase
MAAHSMVQVHIASLSPRGVFYLALKRSEGLKRYPGMWQVVTGGIETGETAAQAALRELFEETGLVPLELYALPFIASFFSVSEDHIQHVPVFAAIVGENDKVLLSKEHSDFQWMGYDDIMELLPFPSHKQGTQIFREYIIEGKNANLFQIPW